MVARLKASDILDDLDDAARVDHGAFFPDFDHGYNCHVDGRLSAFGDGVGRWAVIIEQIAVNPRAGGAFTYLYYHGNAVTLPPQPGWGDHDVQSLTLLDNGPSGPFVDDTGSVVTPEARDVLIRDVIVPIPRDPDFYRARSIEVESLTHEQIDEWIRDSKKYLPPAQWDEARRTYESMREKVGTFELDSSHVLRALVPEHRELLLSTDVERRRGVPADLPMLLQLDDWEHPRLAEGELPRGSECFKQIARVLAVGDPTLYKPPAAGGNVHWSNWPQSGTL